MNIVDRLGSRRLVVCVGPGGVGKTTLAASIGLAIARSGARVLVLTVDPARRLAGVLGEREVGEGGVRRGGVGKGGVGKGERGDSALGDTIRRVPIPDAELWAAMVGTAESYDAWIARLVPSESRRAEILDNRVYQAFSRTLARSHAYIAIERLYDAVSSERFDVVVLDTPPMRSAFELLDAPGRLASFLDDGIVQWFLSMPDASSPSTPRRLLARGGSAALSLLSLATGPSLVREMVGFFRLFASLRPDLEARAGYVRGLFDDPATAFVLVASADANHLDDAAAMRDGLTERGVELAAVIVNRAYVSEPRGTTARWQPVAACPSGSLAAATPASSTPSSSTPAMGRHADLRRRLAALRASTTADNALRTARAEGLVEPLSPRPPLVRLPELEPDDDPWEILAGVLASTPGHGVEEARR